VKIKFLGTGTSQGVPVITCSCNICTSSNPKDNRLRTSILIESEKATVVVDTGPDFRYQMLRAKVKTLSAIVYTHEHKDHTAGLDDIRAFNYSENRKTKIYAHPRVQQAIRREFSYIFSDVKYPGIPKLEFIDIDKEKFIIDDIEMQPIEVMHYRLPVLGFRIKDFVYITDAKTIDEKEIQKIQNCKILVLNALQIEPHISHFTLEEALEMIARIKPETAYLTHISHRLGKHNEVSSELPKNVFLAYDGLVLEI